MLSIMAILRLSVLTKLLLWWLLECRLIQSINTLSFQTTIRLSCLILLVVMFCPTLLLILILHSQFFSSTLVYRRSFDSQTWIIDTRATNHIVQSISCLTIVTTTIYLMVEQEISIVISSYWYLLLQFGWLSFSKKKLVMQWPSWGLYSLLSLLGILVQSLFK